MKIKYYDQTKEINDSLAEYELDYKISDIFKDYGMEKLVRTTRKKMEDLGEARNRSNSIIKEPFDSFPENIIILKITKLIS